MLLLFKCIIRDSPFLGGVFGAPNPERHVVAHRSCQPGVDVAECDVVRPGLPMAQFCDLDAVVAVVNGAADAYVVP